MAESKVQKNELTEEGKLALEQHRLKRKSFIIKLIVGWLALGASIVFFMVFIRSQVERDPQAIHQAVSEYFEYSLPDGFEAWSMNRFWGVTLAVFNDTRNTREDGRTLAVLSINIDDKYKKWSLEEARDNLFTDLEKRLNKREFKVKSKRVETIERDGESIEIHVFSGIHLIDEDYVEATNCYRFIMTSEGPAYLHTLGLNSVFPEEDQCAALVAFKAK